jgi:membrane protease YdiL (CAAX protease family)
MPSSPRERDNCNAPPPPRLDGKWTLRYVVIAYLSTWVVVAAVSVGGLIPTGLGAICIDAAWLLALVPLCRNGDVRPSDFGLRRPTLRGGAFLAVGTVLAYTLVALIWDELANVPYAPNPFDRPTHQGALAIALAAISALLSPVAEELFFRGFVYRALRYHLSVPAASVWVGLMFGLIHTQYSLAVLPELIALGIMLCLVYEYSGSLFPCILVTSYLDVGGILSALLGGNVWTYVSLGFFFSLIILHFSTQAR